MATPLTAKEWEEKHDAIWAKAEAEAEVMCEPIWAEANAATVALGVRPLTWPDLTAATCPR